MKTARKALLIALCCVLLVTASVLGTMAYLTSKTAVVTNTFSVGNVAITLDEAKVDLYGKAVDGAGRVTANAYKLLPGHTYTKDPTVHVDENSEEAWLFVKVVNNISTIEADTTIAAQMVGNWTLVDKDNGVYAYNTTVKANDNITVFKNFKIKGDADVSAYAGKTITVQAYAVQHDGFATAAAAYEAAPCTWGE